MAKSPAAILVDSSGHTVGIVLDGSIYRLQAESKVVRASDGSQINPATEETLASIKGTDGIKKIADALPAGDNNIGNVDLASAIPAGDNNIGNVDLASAIPAGDNNIGNVDLASAIPAGDNNIGNVDLASAIPAGTNEIGKVAQGTKAAAANAWPLYVVDSSGNSVGVVLDGAVYRFRTETKVVRTSDGAQINPATEETLASIKGTDGIKKITDALPAGDNNIGNVDLASAIPAGDNNIGNVDLASAIPAGTNEIGKVAQGTKAAAANAWPLYVVDSSGNSVGVVLDGAIYRFRTEAKVVRASDGAQINPATEETLAAAKTDLDNIYTRQADGNQKAEVSKWIGSASPTVGQKAMAASLPVTLAQDQTPTPHAADVLGTITALDGTVGMAVAGYAGVAVVLSGTWVASLVFEVSSDGGSTWIASSFLSPAGSYDIPIPSVTHVATGNGTYRGVGVPTSTHVRVRASLYTSGTVGVRLVASPVPLQQSFTLSGVMQNVLASVGNTSNVNLATGATFTGATESSLGVAGIQVTFKASHNCTLSLQQSQDGVNWDISDTYLVAPDTAFAQTFQAVSFYYRVVVTNTGGGTTTYFRLGTALCPIVEAVPRTLGQKPMAGSLAVAIASDQSPIAVTAIPLTAISGMEFGLVNYGNTSNVLTSIRATTYNEQLSNFTGSVRSSSVNDTSAGTGARTVEIEYFDQTGTGPYTETVTLNGTTAVNLSNLNHCFIQKMRVLSVGSSGYNQGTISLYAGANATGTVVGSIGYGLGLTGVGDNRTLWAHRYVVLGKKASLYTMLVGTTGNQSGYMVFRVRTPLVANSAEIQVSEFFIVAPGISSTSRALATPIEVTGFALVTMYVVLNGTNQACYGAFDYSEQ